MRVKGITIIITYHGVIKYEFKTASCVSFEQKKNPYVNRETIETELKEKKNKQKRNNQQDNVDENIGTRIEFFFFFSCLRVFRPST